MQLVFSNFCINFIFQESRTFRCWNVQLAISWILLNDKSSSCNPSWPRKLFAKIVLMLFFDKSEKLRAKKWTKEKEREKGKKNWNGFSYDERSIFIWNRWHVWLMIIPNTRKLCTPQNECTPIDWMFASFICKTSNFVNGIKIGLIVNGFFELLITNTWIFGSNDCTGIVFSPSVNEKNRFWFKERENKRNLKKKNQKICEECERIKSLLLNIKIGLQKLTAHNLEPAFNVGVTCTVIRAHCQSVSQLQKRQQHTAFYQHSENIQRTSALVSLVKRQTTSMMYVWAEQNGRKTADRLP